MSYTKINSMKVEQRNNQIIMTLTIDGAISHDFKIGDVFNIGTSEEFIITQIGYKGEIYAIDRSDFGFVRNIHPDDAIWTGEHYDLHDIFRKR